MPNQSTAEDERNFLWSSLYLWVPFVRSFNQLFLDHCVFFLRSAEYGLSHPALMIFKRKDPYQTTSIFSDPFAVQPIVDFVRRSSISSFVSIWAGLFKAELWQSRVRTKFEFRSESLQSKFLAILFVHYLTIGWSKKYWEHFPRKRFQVWTKEKRRIWDKNSASG